MIRLALIGAGAIGKIHAVNLAAQPNVEFIAICDTVSHAVDELAAKYEAKSAHSTDELLNSDLHGVVIASSTASHGEMAQSAIDNGWHFLCEKPLASDQATAAEIARAAEAKGMVAGIGFNRRFHPAYAELRSQVARAELDAFVDAIMSGRRGNLPNLNDGLAAQQIADAAKQSTTERRVVSLS